MRRDLTVADLGDLVELRLLAVLATHRRNGTVLLSPFIKKGTVNFHYDRIEFDWLSDSGSYQPPITVSEDGNSGDGRPGESG